MPAWKKWAWIVGVAFALRAVVAFVLLRAMPQVHDAASYVELAGKLLTDFPGDEAFYWPPGNSLCLAGAFAVFGDSGAVTRGLMLVFGVAGVAFTALLARELSPRKDPRAEWTTGLLAAAYMPAVMLVAQGYAQHLAALTLAAFAYFGLRAVRERASWLYASAGLAFGVGVLTRPSMVSVAPVFLFLWGREIWRERRSVAAMGRLVVLGALFAFPAAAVITPVVLHNAARGAGLTVSTNNERNFFLGNNPYTPSYKTSHLGQRALTELDPEVRDYLESFYERPDARAAMQKEAVDYVVHHPLQTAYRTLNRFTSFWGFDYLASRVIADEYELGNKGLMALLAIEAGTYLAVLVLALLVLVARKDDTDPFFRRGLVALALAYELPYMLAFSGGTYHFPVMPLLLPFAGAAIDGFSRGKTKEWVRSVARSWRAWAAIGVLVLVELEYGYYAIVMKDSS
jgi:4-amino-4-deoxy-L-arabinose transferase-like glycosyltransferase